MNRSRILKWNVPVDEQWHRIGRGRVVHVACQNEDPSVVQVWTLETPGPAHPMDMLPLARVVATGQEFPLGTTDYVGTTMVYAGRIVWHVVTKPGL